MNRTGYLTGEISVVAEAQRVAILKGLTAETRAALGADARVYEGVASANGVARNNGDDLVLDGLDLGDYRKNPVILTNHGMANDGLPIGRALKIEKQDSKLVLRYVLAKEDPYAARIGKLIDEGVLRGLSVGWRTIQAEPIKPEDAGNPFAPHRITKSSLLDVSVVGVGADPDALMPARSMGAGITLDNLNWVLEQARNGATAQPAATDSTPATATPQPHSDSDLAARLTAIEEELERTGKENTARLGEIAGALGIEGYLSGGAGDSNPTEPEKLSIEQARANLKRIANGENN